MADQLEMVRERWNAFAVRFTETANKRMTMQCSQHLHAHMQLDHAQSVLEVAAGAGLGSLDVAQYLADGRSKLPRESKRAFTVTDLSPVMIGLAEKNLSGLSSANVEIKCQEANGQDLVEVSTGSMDRFIASLCIQLAPDPDAILREANRVLTSDGIAGFTIWGSPDRSGNFTIASAAHKEMGFEEGAGEHSNFAMGKDLPALRQRFAAAGFKRVQIWPFQCVVELWSGEEFAKFLEDTHPLEDEALRAKRFAIVQRMADEWLAKGTPIGLETYIILARK
ncbi:Alanine--tRNA ligase [Phytophthora cinnamomi]|uniref:Alanine--tRNA ligase n=1 Tax=Phytophthora cinnamomi TaxID=4785 RepID=UPI0035596F46|nr:Alanine--tRNA ligase [Phytophthora cinnamomi]